MSGTLITNEVITSHPRKRAQRGRPSTKVPQMPGTPKQWRCDWGTCPKSFGRKSDLIRHHHTHTGTRNHKCHFPGCGKTFIQTSALTVHIRTHTGEKPHECQMCNKRFSDSSSLARHRKIHSNDRPYPCKVDECDKSFCRKSTLNKHMGREHPGAAQSPGTDDSDEEPSSSSQMQGETGFSIADQLSQSSAMDVQSPYVKNEMGTFPNPSQYRQVSHPQRVMSDDFYSHTQPSTPTIPTWQEMTHSQSQNSHFGGARNSRFPISLKSVNSMSYNDLGPTSAPIAHTEHSYPTHQDVPHSALYMSTNYAQSYYTDVSSCSTPVPVYAPNGPITSHIHPPMLPSTAEHTNDASRVLQAHVRAEQMVASNDTANCLTTTAMSHAPEIYAYTPQAYQEPVNLGVTADFGMHYQLPDFRAWDDAADDKYPDTFGEPTPSQLASQYTF